MQHSRKDYNERIQDAAGLIPTEEPVFLLRGQDRIAYQFVKQYADALDQIPGVPRDHVEAIRRHANRMSQWAELHGKTPDCPAPLLL